MFCSLWHNTLIVIVTVTVIATTVFMVLCSATVRVHRVHLTSVARSGRWPPTFGPSRSAWANRSAYRQLQWLHSPSPFITTQPESWYSVYHPTEGRRLSRPSWLALYRDGLPARRQSVTHPSTNRAQRRVTSLIRCYRYATPPTVFGKSVAITNCYSPLSNVARWRALIHLGCLWFLFSLNKTKWTLCSCYSFSTEVDFSLCLDFLHCAELSVY